jgi:hypothetical protein
MGSAHRFDRCLATPNIHLDEQVNLILVQLEALPKWFELIVYALYPDRALALLFLPLRRQPGLHFPRW